MPLKRFRNVKWDKKKDFRKSLEKFDLNEEAYEVIDIISNKNIIVTTFNSLLREADIDYKKHIDEMNLIKLYSALGIMDLIDLKDKKKITTEINKAIKKIGGINRGSLKEIKPEDYERDIVSKYKFTNVEDQDYFNYNGSYEKIAEVFSEPFKDQRYFDFAYLFTMYISMEIVFNKYSVPDDMNIFLVKLEVQQKMFALLEGISPENFNTVIINMNKWFKKFDKKFFKLLNRKSTD